MEILRFEISASLASRDVSVALSLIIVSFTYLFQAVSSVGRMMLQQVGHSSHGC